jgi:hypothetical protein
MSLNCSHQRVHCPSPRWYMSIVNHGGMISTEENSRFVHQSSLESYQQSHLVTSKTNGRREWWIWPSKHLCSPFKVIFTRRKNLRHGPSGFNPTPNKGVLLIYIASAGFRTLGLTASALTTEATFLYLSSKNSRHIANCYVICRDF